MSKSDYENTIPALKQIPLTELAGAISPIQTINFKDIPVSGIACTPETLKSGDLYFCIDEFLQYGRWIEGESQLKQAMLKTPAALVTEKPVSGCPFPQIVVENSILAMAAAARYFYGYPDKRIKVIGVTGTNGKTTITHLIRRLLNRTGRRALCTGTIGLYGDAGKISEAVYTTPLSCEIYRMLNQSASDGYEFIAMEISSHALKLGRVYGLTLQSGVFTNITRDHLDFHKTLEDYTQSKTKLFHMIDPAGTAVINMDDPYGPVMADAASCRVIGYSLKNRTELQAVDIRYKPAGAEFTVVAEGKAVDFKAMTPGRFNVYNMLAAIGVLRGLGVDIEQLVEPVAEFRSVPGRMEVVKLPGGRVGVVDYAHTPDALENVLTTTRETATGRIITVFGCGGDRDRGKRSIMGGLAEKLSDLCVVTSDNPRTEDPDKIIGDILDGMCETAHIVEPDRRRAIRKAFDISRENDIILVVGKGHEDYQIIGVEKTHFSDVEELGCLE